MKSGLAIGRTLPVAPQPPKAVCGYPDKECPFEQAGVAQPTRPPSPAFRPPRPRLEFEERHVPISSLLLTPRDCGAMSSPAESRNVVAKSKVSEPRLVIGRGSLGRADGRRGRGRNPAAKRWRAHALRESAVPTLSVMTSASVRPSTRRSQVRAGEMSRTKFVISELSVSHPRARFPFPWALVLGPKRADLPTTSPDRSVGRQAIWLVLALQFEPCPRITDRV